MRSFRASRPGIGPRAAGNHPFVRILIAAVLCVAATASSAAPAVATPTTIAVGEAEQGTLTGWGVRARPDASASNGSAVQYDSGGSARLTVKLPADADGFKLRLRGDQCAGAPAYTVEVDNAPVGGDTVSSTSWTERAYSAPLLAGTHVVDVRYTNDHYQWWPACNRNLYLDAVTFTASDAGAVSAAAALPAGFVHRSGTQLLDGANRPLRLRGVNVGGWLHWEGWMWGQGFDYIGESAMMNNLASLVGTAEAERFRGNVRESFITGGDFRAMSAYGFNVARVPVNYRLLEDDSQPFVYKQSGWDALDEAIIAAKQNNVYLVLDMQAAPCSQNYSFTADYVGSDHLWSSSKCQDRLVALWKAIAARYANENIIAGYDLLNEPLIGDVQLLDLYKRLTAAIRTVDRNHLLVYEGNGLARRFELFTTPLDANQMLSFHDYTHMVWGEDLAARMPHYSDAAKRLNTPQWAGEFGQGGYADIERYVRTFESDPVMAGWAQWTWKQSPGLPSLQTIQHTPASKKLVEWMNNTTRPRPTAAEASQGMSDFVQAIRFENTLHDAKLRHLMCGSNCKPAAAAAQVPVDGGSPAAEAVDAPPSGAKDPGPQEGAPTTGTPVGLSVSVKRSELGVALRRGVKLHMTAPGAGRLDAVAKLGDTVVARGSARTAAAGRRTVLLGFTGGARKTLRRAGRVSLTANVSYTAASGARVGERVTVTLRR